MRGKVLLVLVASVLLIGVAIGWAATRGRPAVAVDETVSLTSPGVFFRDTQTGQLARWGTDGSRSQTGVVCSRVYVAHGRGSCLQRDPDRPNAFRLAVLDDHLQITRTIPVNGVPTRTRVSADGQMLSWTVFVSGDSYASTSFSTRSGILDAQSQDLVDTVEKFSLNGQAVPVDANFWGISFAADDRTFYATMATGPHFYLVRGSLGAQTLEILDDGVECPSLSPDGTRVVYKRRMPDRTWRLWVLDLGTGQRIRLAEPGNVDDQGAWAGDHTVLYGKAAASNGQVDLWSVPADGSGAPTRLATDAESPSVVR